MRKLTLVHARMHACMKELKLMLLMVYLRLPALVRWLEQRVYPLYVHNARCWEHASEKAVLGAAAAPALLLQASAQVQHQVSGAGVRAGGRTTGTGNRHQSRGSDTMQWEQASERGGRHQVDNTRYWYQLPE